MLLVQINFCSYRFVLMCMHIFDMILKQTGAGKTYSMEVTSAYFVESFELVFGKYDSFLLRSLCFIRALVFWIRMIMKKEYFKEC